MIVLLFFLPALVFYEYHIHGKIASILFPVQQQVEATDEEPLPEPVPAKTLSETLGGTYTDFLVKAKVCIIVIYTLWGLFSIAMIS